MGKLSLPPLRDLPPDHFERRKEHLLTEITRQERPTFIFHESLRESLTGWRLRPLLVGGGLVFLAILTLAVLVVSRIGASAASAADVRAKLADASGRPLSIRGEFTVVTRPIGDVHHRTGCLNCYPAAPIPSKFVIAPDGSYAQEGAGTQRTLGGTSIQVASGSAYNATTGVQTSYERGYYNGRPLYVKGTHIDPATPLYSPEAQLAAFVQHALATSRARIRNTAFDGRAAWSLTLRFAPGDEFYDTYGVRADVVVDRATGLVLEVIQYAELPDRWTSIESIHNLKIGGPTDARDFTLPVPPGAQVVRHDYGFRRATVAQAHGIVGYTPLLPRVTGGRQRVDFAVAKTSDQRLFSHIPAPTYHDVVSARYGHGLNSFVVSTRRGRSNVLAQLIQGISAQTVRLRRGPFKGALAYLSTSPPNPGYLVAFQRGLILQVTAFSASEAITIATSLTQAR